MNKADVPKQYLKGSAVREKCELNVGWSRDDACKQREKDR